MKTLNPPKTRSLGHATKTARLGKETEPEVYRFTVTNDAAGQKALKHLKHLTKLHNEVELAKAKKAKDYVPMTEKLTALGRIGRNILFGPRYVKPPQGRNDTSQEKHTTDLENASTIDIYITA